MSETQTIAAAKERPIIFSAPMVLALLAGKKTQTRRVVNPQPVKVGSSWGWRNGKVVWHWPGGVHTCPYGKPGDRLWVRETFAVTTQAISDEPGSVYRATDPDWETMEGWRWSSPIHMPRWASRLSLEITDVRVEQLWDITEDDVVAEGVSCLPREGTVAWASDTRARMAAAWNNVHGPGAWERENPWVWAITFTRLPAAH